MQVSKALLSSLFLLFFISSYQAQAVGRFPLKISMKGLSSSQKEVARKLVGTAFAHFPESMKKAYFQGTTIRFVDLNKGKKIPVTVCKAQAKPQVLGTYGMFRGKKISIDIQLLDHFAHGKKVTFPCGHGNLWKQAIATVAHEVFHAYDAMSGTRANGGLIRKISDDIVFQKKSFWRKKNYMSRVPDPYEKESISEFAAVNFEYFLFDQKYKCRRPHLYRYFSNAFDMTPYKRVACRSGDKYFHAGTKTIETFPRKRLYQVQYLLASKGEGIASGFGHSMFRFVICAPETPMGEACLNDLDHHIVGSFRGNVQDIMLSTLKGLFGGYPSVLFAIPMRDIIAEYTKKEMRNLYGFPLKLNRSQKNLFVDNFLAIHWGYSGDYKFLTTNCATETYELIASIFDNPSYHLPERITPNGVHKSLVEVGLISKKYRKKKDSYNLSRLNIFDSREVPLIKALKDLTESKEPVDRKALVDYLQSSASKRRDLFNRHFSGVHLSSLNGAERKEARKKALKFKVLEGQALEMFGHNFLADLTKAIDKKSKDKNISGTIRGELKQRVRALTQTQHSFLVGNYGIPQKGDRIIKASKKTVASPEEVEKFIEDIVGRLGINVQSGEATMAQIQENVELFSNVAERLK